MKSSLRTVPDQWRRAPRVLLDRLSEPEANSVQPAKVALHARIPETGARSGVVFSLAEAAGLDPHDGAPAGFEILLASIRGLVGTLSFPPGFDGAGEYVAVSMTSVRPLGASGSAELTAAAASLAVEVGEGARAALFLEVGAEDGAESLLLSTLRIRVGEGASLDVYALSEGGAAFSRVDRSAVTLERSARLSWTEASFETGASRAETVFELAGEGSELEFNGAYGARGGSDRERVVVERHRAPRTRSRAVLKSALRDESRLVFRGLIEVFPEAPGTDAYLSNRNLLLDDGARAESLPQLKIDQDDVACSHGSTTGGPREEELFYLMSRGLDRDAARSLIAVGHLESVLGRVPADLRPRFEAAALRAVEDRP